MTREGTQRFFDGRANSYYAANYETPRNRHAYNLVLRREACLALVPRTDGLVLDLGCGPGAMTIPLLERGYRVAATDLSPQMVAETARRARDVGNEPPAVAAADALALPFADGTFAVVVTTGVLEYVEHIELAVREIVRVLRPGGTVIATMSLPRSFERLATRMVARARNSPRVAQYIHTRHSFDRVLAAEGLHLDHRECCSFAPFPLDALWPRSVTLIDRTFGSSLNKLELARNLAKTYIVRATR